MTIDYTPPPDSGLTIEGDQYALWPREQFAEFSPVPWPGEVEPPRADTDCRCSDQGCPCEADGPDGLCKCCRTGDHNGSCGFPEKIRPAA